MMRFGTQILVAMIAGTLLSHALRWLGLGWPIQVLAGLLLGGAVVKFWPWGQERKQLHQAHEASVIGAMLMGGQTTIDIWRISDRSYLAVATTLSRLEARGDVVSLWENEDGEYPRRRLYFLTHGNQRIVRRVEP